MHVRPATFPSRFLALQCMRSAYCRPCGASIRQGNRAGTRRANANWKREVKVPESPRLRRFAPTSSARSFVRSFASTLYRYPTRRRRVTIDAVTPRRKNDERCSFGKCCRTTTLVDECAESRDKLSERRNGNRDC